MTKIVTINNAKEWSEAVDALVHQKPLMQTYLKTTPFDEADEELYEILAELIFKDEDDTDAFIELDYLYCCFGYKSSIDENPHE